jgi:hypothetical protein
MIARQHFASPVRFDCKVEKDGSARFHDAATTGGSKALEVGKIYLKTRNPSQGPNRNIKISVGELKLPAQGDGDQTFEKFSNYTRTRKLNPLDDPGVRNNNEMTVEGPFPSRDKCVPGFDYGCKSDQDGFLLKRSSKDPKRDPKVVAAHFLVDITLTGFSAGEKVSGYLLLELKDPKSKK